MMIFPHTSHDLKTALKEESHRLQQWDDQEFHGESSEDVIYQCFVLLANFQRGVRSKST